ncbi:MAG: ribosome biogenesis GTPase Der [Eubacterium sp.]|nr:ribosome biogenesis GTPase Der [Eubacterium sp.]
MSRPVVAVVGRPNVGKSTLFNTLAGSRISIVEDTPGVTRDRIYADVTWLNYQFTLVDTGGIEPDSDDIILSRMREQAETAITTADVILFLTDVRQGLTDADFKVADMLRRSRRPVLLIVNKVDNFDKFMPDVYEFYNLGLGDPIPISAAGKLGIGDMLDQVVDQFNPEDLVEEEDDRPKIAVIGKPNAGKSSIINKLLGEERVIVSPIAGTTRDAIDTTVKRNGQEYVFIDTAGLRRKSKVKEELERYSIIRTVTAVERCDVAVLIIDATEGVTEQDAKIAGIAHERGKGVIIAVNKWDLIEKDNSTVQEFTRDIRSKLSYMPYAEMIFLSAKTGQRLPKLFDMIDAVIENCALRVQTGVLNEILTEAMAMKQPPSDKGKRLRIYYITQVSVKPPTFVMFINDKKLTHFSYTRYLENQIRSTFGFRGTPIRFIYRERKENS